MARDCCKRIRAVVQREPRPRALAKGFRRAPSRLTARSVVHFWQTLAYSLLFFHRYRGFGACWRMLPSRSRTGHKSEVHVQLLVTVEERQPRIVRDKINGDLL